MKKNTTIFIDEEIIKHVKKNVVIKSLSDWVEEKYIDEFMNLLNLTLLLETKQNEVNNIKNIIHEIKKKDSKTLNLKPTSYLWIQNEGVNRCKRNDIKNVYRFFINRFGEDITLRQFRILIENNKEI